MRRGRGTVDSFEDVGVCAECGHPGWCHVNGACWHDDDCVCRQRWFAVDEKTMSALVDHCVDAWDAHTSPTYPAELFENAELVRDASGGYRRQRYA